MDMLLLIAAPLFAFRFWWRMAELDDRYVLNRAPWVWGVVGAGWTLVGALSGDGWTGLALRQATVLLLMFAVVTWSERAARSSEEPARGEALPHDDSSVPVDPRAPLPARSRSKAAGR